MREPIGVLQVVDRFHLDKLPPLQEGYRAALETRPEFVRVAAAIEREGASLVHAVGRAATSTVVAAARLMGARVVCQLVAPAHDMPQALACRSADAVVVGSAQLVFSRKVYVIYPSAEPALFALPPGQPPAQPSAPVIAAVGALRLGNGWLDLVEAAARLRPHVPGLQVLCAGEGMLRSALEEKIRYHGLRDTVHLLGHRSDVPSILSRAAVACLPRHETRPSRALVECMAAGLPVVSTCAELVGKDVGFVVPPRSPALVAERLLSLLGEPRKARLMGSAARLRVVRELSTEQARRRLGEVYTAALTLPGDRATPPRAPATPEARPGPGH